MCVCLWCCIRVRVSLACRRWRQLVVLGMDGQRRRPDGISQQWHFRLFVRLDATMFQHTACALHCPRARLCRRATPTTTTVHLLPVPLPVGRRFCRGRGTQTGKHPVFSPGCRIDAPLWAPLEPRGQPMVQLSLSLATDQSHSLLHIQGHTLLVTVNLIDKRERSS